MYEVHEPVEISPAIIAFIVRIFNPIWDIQTFAGEALIEKWSRDEATLYLTDAMLQPVALTVGRCSCI
jgi:hypothetical protein